MIVTADDLERRILLPPAPGSPEQQRLAKVSTVLRSQHARLIGPKGDEIELPDELHTVIGAAVHALLAGRAVGIAPFRTLLSTQEAANRIGISRPTLVKLLDEGEIPFEQSGEGQPRKIRLADVEDYRQRLRQSRRKALRQLTQENDEAGLYDVGTGFINTR